MEREVKGTEVQVALQGTLETFALADVLRLLASTKKTGALRIDGDRGFGQLSVVDGELVKASATSAPRAERSGEVLFELLRYQSGSFVFDGDADIDAGDQRDSVEEALADAEEQLREWREIEAVVPSPTRMLTLVADRGGRDLTLTSKQWSAVVAMGEGCDAATLGERLGLSELPATRMVRDLVELGAVEIGEERGSGRSTPKASTPAAAPPSPEPVVEAPAPPPPPPVVEDTPPPIEEAPPVVEPIVVEQAPPPAPMPEAAPPPPAPMPEAAPPPPPPPAAPSHGSSSFADTPSFLAEPSPGPAPAVNDGPLFPMTDSSNNAFAPAPQGSTSFAPAPPEPSAFAPAPVSDPMSGWDDDESDGLSSFHDDTDDTPSFGGSTETPGPDDPFGPDPFQIPNFGASAQDIKESEEAAEMARQLANLSPRAQQAVAAAAAANTDEERDHAIDQAERASDEPINRNLLLKYLSSVDE